MLCDVGVNSLYRNVLYAGHPVDPAVRYLVESVRHLRPAVVLPGAQLVVAAAIRLLQAEFDVCPSRRRPRRALGAGLLDAVSSGDGHHSALVDRPRDDPATDGLIALVRRVRSVVRTRRMGRRRARRRLADRKRVRRRDRAPADRRRTL